MNTNDLLKKQLELTQKIIERIDTMIDVMKNDLNIETDTGNTDDVVEFYTPSEGGYIIIDTLCLLS